jgi:hypothetical protein
LSSAKRTVRRSSDQPLHKDDSAMPHHAIWAALFGEDNLLHYHALITTVSASQSAKLCVQARLW